MKTKHKQCPICGCTQYIVIFNSTHNQSDINKEIFSARRKPDKIHGTIIKCKKCGLIRTYETIDKKKLHDLYKKSLFTYKSDTPNLVNSYKPILERAIQNLGETNSFLEIGCGNGFMLREAKKLGFKSVFGIEPSQDAISHAPSTIRKHIIKSVFKDGLFPQKTFDLIVVFQVFDHIQDPNKFLKTCHNLLKPQGLLLIMNHNVNALSAKILGERSPIYDIEHTYLYSHKTINAILNKNGYRVIDGYNPPAVFSIRYISNLLPIPNSIKSLINKSKSGFFSKNIKIYPGNLAVISQPI